MGRRHDTELATTAACKLPRQSTCATIFLRCRPSSCIGTSLSSCLSSRQPELTGDPANICIDIAVYHSSA